MITLYNSLTRKKEPFIPIEENKVRMYACGPTVYNLFHIGNARMLVLFDVLRRYLEYRGFDVTFVQNFTDIDDKIINRALEENLPAHAIAEKYIAEYFIDAAALGIRPASIHPKATDSIPHIISMISSLIAKDFAYVSQGSVYFRTRNFKEYGKLSRQSTDALESGARIDLDELKESPLDFVLWKAAKPNEPFWNSPWGDGRPGWHIECSAMCLAHLGPTIDIHCGGQDLIFPHHENEIAQSEAANGSPFANFWLHNGFINVDNLKMSKSTGNFFTVRDAAKTYGYPPIRFFLLSAHYRSPLNFSADSLVQASAALNRISVAFRNFSFLADNLPNSSPLPPAIADFLDSLPLFRNSFVAALDDDFNTADAISVIFDLIRAANSILASPNLSSNLPASHALLLLREFCDLLGIPLDDSSPSADSIIQDLILQRNHARSLKNFALADRIRDEIRDLGFAIEDTPLGTKWHKL